MPRKSPLLPTRQRQLARVRASRTDFIRNGIDLRDGEYRTLWRLVRLHLDYFQCMLGYDATPREIVSLLEEAARSSNAPAADARSGVLSSHGLPLRLEQVQPAPRESGRRIR